MKFKVQNQEMLRIRILELCIYSARIRYVTTLQFSTKLKEHLYYLTQATANRNDNATLRKIKFYNIADTLKINLNHNEKKGERLNKQEDTISVLIIQIDSNISLHLICNF